MAGDASGKGIYAAHFSNINQTVFSRKLTAAEKNESCTYCECLVILSILTNSLSPIFSFKGQQIMHLTDNKGVVSVFKIVFPKPALQATALKVYKVAKYLNLKLHFHWRTRSDPTMQLVDRGCRGPWLDFDDFAMDSESIQEVRSRKINHDGLASYHNKVVSRFISAGFQIEAEGTDFFTQKFLSTNVILLPPHPVMLYSA